MIHEGGVEVALTLTLMQVGDEVHCSLESGTTVEVREVTPSSLVPLLPELRVNGRRTITLAGNVSHELEYAVFLMLGEVLKPVKIIDRKGIALKTV